MGGFVRLEYVRVQSEAFSSVDSWIDNVAGMDETFAPAFDQK
jgi:hypothetical protein